MPPPGQSASSEESKLQLLLAGQGATDQKFAEIFRRLDKAETTAGEARDTAKEIVTILREQNALARIAEVRAEVHQLVQDLRADLVKAVENLRKEAASADEKITGLEATRSTASGTARAGRWLFEVAKLICAAGGGALVLRIVGGH